MILLIGLPLILVYGLILGLNYMSGKQAAVSQMKSYLAELTAHQAARLDSKFLQISTGPRDLARILPLLPINNPEDIYQLLEHYLTKKPDIYGMSISFAPYQSATGLELFAPYVYREEGDFQRLNLKDSYDYQHQDFYQIPALLSRPYWTEPYFDAGVGNALMITYSVPVFRDDSLLGIITADVRIDELQEEMRKLKILAGYTFLISRHGTYIYHPLAEDIMRETIFSKAERYDFNEMRTFGREMIAGKSGVKPFNDPISGGRRWLVYSPLESTGWSFAAIVPEEEILVSVNRVMMHQALIMILGLMVILLIVSWVSYGITNPIRKLAGMSRQLAAGNLEVQLESIKGRDEIQEFAQAFNKMVVDLKHYITDLTSATRAKEAVESELRIARQIQESLLPRVFPPFPDRVEFELYARIIPAREVAGDFYDFFFLDRDNLALVIADVSGKGISAGLFMAVTRTLIKTVFQEGVSPAMALTRANQILCLENDACMFTTLFLGLYNVQNGEMIYANAGHNPPVVLTGTGQYQLLDKMSGIALGIADDFLYQETRVKLGYSDMIILYTDGVVEATSPQQELYGEDRLLRILIQGKDNKPRQIIESLEAEVQAFQQGNQFDDITIMILRRLNQ